MSGDSANAVLGVIAEKLITPVVDATGRQFGYLFCYKTNIKNLEKRVGQVEKARNDADRFFRAHEQNNEERADSSAAWLNEVADATKKAKEVLDSTNKLKGPCPNLKGQYVVSRKSTKLAEEIRKLQVQAPKIITSNPTPAGMLPGSSSNDGSKGYESRIKAMDDVIAGLEDDTISIIGICGLGGVGKTTMVHELREKAIRQNLFDEVAMTSVSQDPDLFKIQEGLGEMLGLERLKDLKNVTARADQLRQRLTKRNKVLVILDDVWDEIKLKEVGIPIGSDCKGCKVVLTSRSESACTRTGSQRNIKVKELSKEEARVMFKEAAGECAESKNLEGIAKEVAAECGGLPIALVTLAKALSNYKEKEAWEDARKQLRESHVTSIPGMDEKVYKSIKLSYDFLAREQPQAQPLLLLCCQHPEDTRIEVEKLVRYSLALELFEDVKKLNEARNRVYVLVEHLKSCFLLQACAVDDFEREYRLDDPKVIIHDVVRDVCLSIVSKVKEEREKIYMHVMPREKNNDDVLSSGAVSYPKLKLLLQAPFGGNLGKDFLQQMKELRVFEDAEYDEKHHPPGALNFLTKLRMLSLRGALIDEDAMSMILELRELEILSFWGSKIGSFPWQIAQLSNLKILDLRCFEGSGPIPSNVLPQLNKLEMLYTGKFHFPATPNSAEDGINGESLGRLAELDSLSNLTTLQILFENSMELLDSQHVLFEKLERFSFRSTGFDWFFFQGLDSLHPSVERMLALERVGMKWVLGTKMESIVRKTVDLHLKEIDWPNLHLIKKFVMLERLEMTKWNRLKYIVHDDTIELGEDASSCNVFMNLEALTISEMKNVREFCHNGNLRAGSLGKLKKLRMWSLPKMRHLWVGPTDSLCLTNLRDVSISNCEALEYIFPQSAAKCLVQLHRLNVSSCQELEGIVCLDETEVTLFPLLFPKLRYLSIKRTPKLQGFYSFDDDRLQSLLNPLVMLPSLEEFHVYSLQLKQIVGVRILDVPKLTAYEWLQNLKRVDVSSCKSLRTVFDVEGQQALGENARVVTLGKLQEIALRSLPKLTHIFHCRIQDISVPQLRVIHVDECDDLVNIVASNLLKLLQNLKQVKLRGCESVKAAFNFEGLEVTREDAGAILGKLKQLRLWYLRNLEHLFMLIPKGVQGFENLKLLDVRSCKCLGYLLSSSVAYMLVKLENLIVSDCRIMKEVIKVDEGFVEKKIVFRSLRCVKLVRLKNLLSFCSSDLQGFEFPSLEQVLIVECPLMKTFCCGPLTTEKLQEVNFAHSRFKDGKLQGVKRAHPPFGLYDDDNDDVDVVDGEPVWKKDLNETVRYSNARIDQVGDSDDEFGYSDSEDVDDIQGSMESFRDESVKSNNEVLDHGDTSSNTLLEQGNSSKPIIAMMTPLVSFPDASSALVSVSPSPPVPHTLEAEEVVASIPSASWEGHMVTHENKNFLEAVEKYFPDTFDGVNFHNEVMWQVALETLCRFLLKFLVVNVYDLSSKEVAELRGMLLDLKIFKFKVDWAVNRLDKVEKLRFGSPYPQELADIERHRAPLLAKVEDLETELALARKELGDLNFLREEKMNLLLKELGGDGLYLLEGSLGQGLLPSYQSGVNQMNQDLKVDKVGDNDYVPKENFCDEFVQSNNKVLYHSGTSSSSSSSTPLEQGIPSKPMKAILAPLVASSTEQSAPSGESLVQTTADKL